MGLETFFILTFVLPSESEEEEEDSSSDSPITIMDDEFIN
jgi:hypothetical protein